MFGCPTPLQWSVVKQDDCALVTSVCCPVGYESETGSGCEILRYDSCKMFMN